MVVNDDASCLIDRVVWTSIASKLRSYRRRVVGGRIALRHTPTL